ncbi:unnamed protein product, partial [Medioppia subpectinata]
YLRRQWTYWARQGLPSKNHPDVVGFFKNHHEWTLEQVNKYGRVYGTYTMITSPAIIVSEPDLLRDITTKDFSNFPDRRHFHTGSSPIGQSLFLMPGNDDWKRQRSILSPAFTSGKLRAMMAQIDDISDKLVVNLNEFARKGETVDMRKYIGAFAMDVISACAYGINPESINNPDHPVVTNAMKILNIDVGVGFITSVMFPKLAKLLGCEPFDIKAVKYFDELTNQILSERKTRNKYTANDKSKRRTDFIQLMIDSEETEDKDNGYNSISDGETEAADNHQTVPKKSVGTLSADELTAQSIFFFIAGYDTTSAAITHAIYYLSEHKDCQQILYEELQTCNEFTYENLSQLKYLNAVINETLRLAPSLTRVQRECLSDYKLGNTGITIPKGASVEILPYALHRQADLWPNPNDFIPDRFLNPVHHPYAFMPFGGGPRLCIGQRFALNEMRMCLAKLVNSMEFTPSQNKTKLEYFNGSILMSPKSLMVNLEIRN